MSNLPLHPAIVHLPLGLAIFLPLIAIVFCIAIWREWLSAKSWTIVAVLHLLLFGSAVLATTTGEQEEERVENTVGESPLESHEEKAKTFTWASGLSLILTGGAALFRKKQLRLAAQAAATLGLMAVAGLSLVTGHSGGTLVYQEGAANAYVGLQNSESGKPLPEAPKSKTDEED